MCAISTFSCEQVKPLNFCPPCCWLVRSACVALLWRRSVRYCDRHLPDQFVIRRKWTGKRPTAWKQLRWRRRLDLIYTSGQRRTNTLVARTYARFTGPPSKKSRRASGQCRGLANSIRRRHILKPENDHKPSGGGGGGGGMNSSINSSYTCCKQTSQQWFVQEKSLITNACCQIWKCAAILQSLLAVADLSIICWLKTAEKPV